MASPDDRVSEHGVQGPVREMTRHRPQPPSDTSAFESIHRDLTVARIATPKSQLETCTQNEPIAVVQLRNTRGYDYLPVEDDGRIIGLFHARPYRNDPPDHRIIGDVMDVLSDTNLIGADAAILDFLKEVEAKPFRLVVSGGGISGLVAWSDLQKLPVRTALFGLITGFELTMFEAIKSKYPAGEGWLDLLNPGRQDKVWEALERGRASDSDVDPLLYTQFCDKATILRQCFRLPGSAGPLGKIERLRNKLAHANNYVGRRQDANRASAIVKALIALREEVLGHIVQVQ